MDSVTIVESVSSTADIDPAQAAALRSLGRRLASTKAFWGDTDADDDDDKADRSVIRCTRRDDDRYDVLVKEAVGVVSLPGLQIVVEPKIPIPHFVYLLTRCDTFPRVSEEEARAPAERSLWEVVAVWYVRALELVLRFGLLSDYREVSDDLRLARGAVRPLETASLYYRGNVAFACDFEEFDVDSPLNRILRAAALQVAQAPLQDDLVRRRARRALARLDHVGDLQPTDLHVELDRRSWFCRDAHLLALRILAGTGTIAEAGGQRAWTFLIRTPEPVEQAIRNVLREGLANQVTVRKQGRGLGSLGLTLNPDLVFDSLAVGDVKYRVASAKWRRSDIYQLTTFATGFHIGEAGLFGFSNGEIELPEVSVGPVNLSAFFWNAHSEADPGRSASALVARAVEWLAPMGAQPGCLVTVR